MRWPARNRLAIPLFLSFTLLFVAGCTVPDAEHGHGDDGHGHADAADGHGGGSQGTLPIDGTEAAQFDVTGGQPSEYRFTPETIEVNAGERVGIVFRNEGVIAHEFSINDIGFHLHAEADETLQAAFIAPAAGEYVIGCYVPGHFESGMKGTLIVT